MDTIPGASEASSLADRQPDPQTRDDFHKEVRDAAALLEYAVSQGRTLEPSLIPRIKKSQGFLFENAPWPGDADRSDFEAAYRDLAQALRPVTAATLQATRDRGPLGSEANRFSKRLYLFVFLCAGLILFRRYLTSDGATPSRTENAIDGSLPFIYGLIGALTYLLRSAHSYIADRSFDMNRRPEYYNRMVLGFLAGGIVFLFGTTPPSGASSNALSFLVGYNTDYLFQMIERLAQAIFPKETTQAAPPTLAGLTLEKDALKSGDAGNATIALTGKAPSGGTPVSLTADAGVTLTAANVNIPEGSASASFTFRIDVGQSPGAKLHIVAKLGGSSVTTAVTVA